jgi:hypothetical protein
MPNSLFGFLPSSGVRRCRILQVDPQPDGAVYSILHEWLERPAIASANAVSTAAVTEPFGPDVRAQKVNAE